MPVLLCEALAWALSLGGLIALPALVLRGAPGDPFDVVPLLVAWLAAGAVFTPLRRRRPEWRRIVGVAGAALVAWSLGEQTSPSGSLPLFAVAIGWAGVQVAIGAPSGERPALAAALGAALAWTVIGDYSNYAAFAARLSWAFCLLALCLTMLSAGGAEAVWPDSPTRSAWLLNCSPMPIAIGAPWSVRLAAWSMLPMMISLPWMASLCRGGGWPPMVELGLHYALMFAPACVVGSGAAAASGARDATHAAGATCVALLGLAVLLFVVLPAPAAWMALTLCQGAAWAVAQWPANVEKSIVQGRRVASTSVHRDALR